MALTYDQLIKSDASNPEAVKALTGLLGIPTGGSANFYSDPTVFKDNLANLQRTIGEQVAGTRGSSPNGEFQKFGEYSAWGGDVAPLQAQLAGVQQKYANAGVDFNSSPLAVLNKIAGLSSTLTPEQNGSRVTSQNYGGGEFGQVSQSPTQVFPNNNRSLISQTPQAGYIKGYDTNNGYSEVYVPKGQYVPGISLTPKQITSSSLTGGGTTTVPGLTSTGTNEAGAMVAGAGTSIAEIMKQMTPPETETDKKQQGLLDQMASLVGEQANKAADQLTAEQSAGIPQLKEQFAKINAQILSQIAEYKELENQYNATLIENRGKPITMNSIIGNEAQINYAKQQALNQRASSAGLLQAQAQGLQGQIEVAQQTANRAIDLRYSSLEAKLNVYQAQLNALQPTLNKEEKLQAMAQQTLIDQQKQALADAKSKEKEQNGVILDLISKYPDANISFSDSLTSAQSKLKSSKIYQQATRLVGGGSSSGGGGAGGGNFLGGINPTTGKQIDFGNAEEVKKLPISEISKAIISGYGSTKDLTPTDKTQVISELYRVGYDPKKGVMDKLDNLVTQLEKVSSKQRGVLQGYTPATWSDEASAFESAKIVLTRQIARLYDVGMLSDQDVADYKNAMPARTDWSLSASKAKVKGLKSAVGAVGEQTPSNSSSPAKGTDGTAYGFPGYVSDGTQWVKK